MTRQAPGVFNPPPLLFTRAPGVFPPPPLLFKQAPGVFHLPPPVLVYMSPWCMSTDISNIDWLTLRREAGRGRGRGVQPLPSSAYNPQVICCRCPPPGGSTNEEVPSRKKCSMNSFFRFACLIKNVYCITQYLK